jgi:hypothetical protein
MKKKTLQFKQWHDYARELVEDYCRWSLNCEEGWRGIYYFSEKAIAMVIERSETQSKHANGSGRRSLWLWLWC